jgi:hypothetical protein
VTREWEKGAAVATTNRRGRWVNGYWLWLIGYPIRQRPRRMDGIIVVPDFSRHWIGNVKPRRCGPARAAVPSVASAKEGSTALRTTASGQLDRPTRRFRVLTVEEGSVAHGAHPHAAAFIGDLGAKGGALVAFRPEETEFHQFMGPQLLLQFGEKRRGQPALAKLERRGELLAEAAEVGLLGTGEGKVVHGNEGEYCLTTDFMDGTDQRMAT